MRSAAWDGRLTSGSWAAAAAYLLRITATDAAGTHPAPAVGVDGAVLAAWGVSADLTGPTRRFALADRVRRVDDGIVTATMNESVTGDRPLHFTLIDSATGAPVAGSVAYDAATRRATYRPTVALASGSLYRATLRGAIRDAAGNLLSRIAWTLRTAPEALPPTPVAGAHLQGGNAHRVQLRLRRRVTATEERHPVARLWRATSHGARPLPTQPVPGS